MGKETWDVKIVPQLNHDLFSFTKAMKEGWQMNGRWKEGGLIVELCKTTRASMKFDRMYLPAVTSPLLALSLLSSPTASPSASLGQLMPHTLLCSCHHLATPGPSCPMTSQPSSASLPRPFPTWALNQAKSLLAAFVLDDTTMPKPSIASGTYPPPCSHMAPLPYSRVLTFCPTSHPSLTARNNAPTPPLAVTLQWCFGNWKGGQNNSKVGLAHT